MNADRVRQTAGRLRDVVVGSDALVLLVAAVGVYALLLVIAIPAGFDDLPGVLGRLRAITFLAALYAMIVLALNLQWGYAGLLNLGVAGFMAIGVYTMAILSAPTDALGLGLPLWVGMVGGVLVAALVGALAALPALRLEADYLAIVTLALGEIIRLSIRSDALAEFSLAGQTVGTGGTDSVSLPSGPVRRLLYEEPGSLVSPPSVLGDAVFQIAAFLDVSERLVEGWVYVFLLLGVLALMYVFLVRLGNSPFGRVLKAIREDELVATSLGKDVRTFKIKVFAVGCGLMALVGMLWWLQRGRVSPSAFEPELTFFVFVALIIGGAGSNTGSVIGGLVLAGVLLEGPDLVQTLLGEYVELDRPSTILEAFDGVDPFLGYFFSDVNLSALQLVMLGVVLIYLMQRRPAGLLGHRTDVAASVDLDARGEREDEP